MIYGRIKALVEEQLHVPVIGYVPELGFLQVGSRHLGLVLPDEIDGLKEQMERLADCMENTVDLDVLAMVCSGKEKMGQSGSGMPGHRTQPGQADSGMTHPAQPGQKDACSAHTPMPRCGKDRTTSVTHICVALSITCKAVSRVI